jgi:hypothetical protein
MTRRSTCALVALVLLCLPALAVSADVGAQPRLPAMPPAFRAFTMDRAGRPVKTAYVPPASLKEIFVSAHFSALPGAGTMRYRAAVDRAHRLTLIERSCCAYYEYVLLHTALPAASASELSGFRLNGIGVGSSAGDVVRTFGANSATSDGILRYRARDPRNDNCAWYYDFAIRKGLVRAISLGHVC